MTDFAFIRLKPTLQEALDTNPSAMSNIGYFNQIRLATDETYTQITNLDDDIAFNGNYLVTVCDCEGIDLLDITSKITITQFLDNKGIPQIVFTIANVGVDFYEQPILLKFKHTVSDYIWYSNLFNITDENKYLTTRFDYRDYSEFNGIAYNIVNKYQSIRLNCYFKGNDSESKGAEYTSIDGIKVVSRLIETEFEKYRFEKLDNFTYRRINKLLSHPIIYINDNRVTDKQTLKSKDFEGRSNFMTIDFNVAINYNESFSVNNALNYKDFNINDWDNNDFLT